MRESQKSIGLKWKWSMYTRLRCNVPVSRKKTKVKIRFFLSSHVPHLTPFPTTHFHSSLYLFGRLTLFPSFLFFIFSHTLISITLILSTSTSYHHHHHHFHHHFSDKITRKFLRTYKQLHILFFEVKFYNLFGGFYTFA